ncbi:MAG: hypothetical protein J5858_04940 [Lentisphaeria bacterium]|nr:hypothetical protein [Lentisphaeria bacterium]
MKRELISATLGALAASAVWCGIGLFAKQKNGIAATAPLVTKVLSSQRQGRFPGLKLYDFDFLIPLNRLILTQYVSVDPPDGDYGKEGRPSSAFVFGIQEKNTSKWFLASGIQNDIRGFELRYLGENIIIDDTTSKKGNGYYTVKYQFLKSDRQHESCVSHASICGEPPKMENDVSESLVTDARKEYTGNLNWFRNKSRNQMFLELQKAVAENDRRTVANFFSYPVTLKCQYPTGVASWTYYTPDELVRDFDLIFTKGIIQEILNGSVKDIRKYRWGYLLPGNFFCDDSLTGESSPILGMP